MGNNPNGPGLFNDYTDYPCRVQLGRYTFIDVTYTEIKRNCSDSDDEVPSDNDEVPGDSEDEVPSDSDDEVPSDSDDEVPSDDDEVPSDDDDEVPSDSDDEVTKVTTMLYTVDRSSTCELKFERRHKEASLSLHDADNCSNFTGVDLEIIIRKTDKGYLEIPVPEIAAIANSREVCILNWGVNSNRTINAWGEVKEYTNILYGKGRRGSLVVIESKKKSISDPNPYMVTVLHYLAVDDGNVFNPKLDIGFSVVVKIQTSDDLGLKYTVEGPERHPSSSLFYMFERVKRLNGAWKSNLCPHCANLQMRRKSWQTSESEDSDYVPRRHGNGKQKSESMVANDSNVKGNFNGSLFGKYFHFHKR
ncbi:unnamed protein product [Lathyrus oleraceus]|uniref:Uncharacterized protein n=1 Tax=Pisum sativum TaxID=3888 RepID=A0A9D5BEA8_PEA|nr:uncharacterized protein LOC127117255 isoform X1 [Pisum sativum]XP_050903388.1 uncharacterized protein LOC127117255 isoform X1 [Pisum sativum]KAI5441965.1 hypothetical protein KIW84_011142 [Pisum sativum]